MLDGVEESLDERRTRRRIYQQTFIDTYAKVVFAKLYDCKTPITAAEILNDRVLPFFERAWNRVVPGRQSEHHGELYLAVEDIDHTRTKTKSAQTNGICERFHRTVLDEFYRVAFRRKSTAPSTSCRGISMPG